ncbi:hypothetical protein DPEC_G00303840 [Dallia pectoralis]|uniref:Uncharacterized protein n=1 Tax=Dallia pectoralis TaxID=75939 RepID=A0ACC2FDI5_DALPE|nr:hypothetical protein DPEC_G00303840 [Dallia pectoralis]
MSCQSTGKGKEVHWGGCGFEGAAPATRQQAISVYPIEWLTQCRRTYNTEAGARAERKSGYSECSDVFSLVGVGRVKGQRGLRAEEISQAEKGSSANAETRLGWHGRAY